MEKDVDSVNNGVGGLDWCIRHQPESPQNNVAQAARKDVTVNSHIQDFLRRMESSLGPEFRQACESRIENEGKAVDLEAVYWDCYHEYCQPTFEAIASLPDLRSNSRIDVG